MIRSSADTVASHDEPTLTTRNEEEFYGVLGSYTGSFLTSKGYDAIKAAVDALIDAVRADSQPAWQEIATAPKDGTEIVALANGHYIGTFDRGLEEWVNAVNYHTIRPTHWMPLPDPPQVGSGNQVTDAEPAVATDRSAAQKS